MSAGHANPGVVNGDPVLHWKRVRDLFLDLEIGAEVVGGKALDCLNQPAGISHQQGLIRGRGAPQIVEHMLNLRQSIISARAVVPNPHAKEFEAPDDVQAEERMRVADAAVPARPPRLPPQVEGAHHQLRRFGRAVVQSGNVARREATAPVRGFQLTSQPPVAFGDPGGRKEAVFTKTGQQRTVLEISDWLALRVQHALDPLDDGVPTGQKQAEELDMRLKRDFGRTPSS